MRKWDVRIASMMTVVLLLLSLGWQRPAQATLWSYQFEPHSGGPGTRVHVWGYVPHVTVVIRLGLAQEYIGTFLDAGIHKFQPVAVLGRVQTHLDNAKDPTIATLDTRVTIPSRTQDGSPITTAELALELTEVNGKVIPETGPQGFLFAPDTFPGDGQTGHHGMGIGCRFDNGLGNRFLCKANCNTTKASGPSLSHIANKEIVNV